MFGLLRSHRLVYRKRFEVGGDVTAFAFSVENLHARAGQHMVVAATTALRKPFSLASAPEEEFAIIGTSLRSGSPYKKKFASLTEGEEISARGPVFTYFKPFVLDPSTPSHTPPRAVLLAQGVGVTPFRSMLGHLALTGQVRSTHLIHVASRGHAFQQDTARWATETTYASHTADFREAINAAVETDPSSVFYIAGAPAFISSTVKFMHARGVPRSQIRDDPYLFYKPSPAAR